MKNLLVFGLLVVLSSCAEHKEVYPKPAQYLGDNRNCVIGCLNHLVHAIEVEEESK